MASSTMPVHRCWLAVHPRRDANGAPANGELFFVRLPPDGMGDGLSQPGGLLTAWMRHRHQTSGERERTTERVGRDGRKLAIDFERLGQCQCAASA
jgi:hypothetical protein